MISYILLNNVGSLIISNTVVCRKNAISPVSIKHLNAPSSPAYGSFDVHFCPEILLAQIIHKLSELSPKNINEKLFNKYLIICLCSWKR